MGESDKSGEAACFVAKGPCGHYYWAAVAEPMYAKTAHEMAVILKRPGHVVEIKTVQFVRDGGLDWSKECRAGKCGATK
jgi:hypothetical protein